MNKSNGVRTPEAKEGFDRLVVLPANVYKKAMEGDFTLDQIVHGKEAMDHLSDMDILDILALNQTLPFVEKLNSAALLSNDSQCERVYKLNELLRTSPSRDVVANFADQSPDNVMTHQCSTGESAIGDLIVINSTSQRVHVSCIAPSVSISPDLIAFLTAKLISSKYGYRHMVRVNGGLLYNELKKIITNQSKQDDS